MENFFEKDGSAKIGDVSFCPVGLEDKAKALDDNSPTVTHGVEEDKYARYDAFSADGNKFCGHQNIYYDRGGSMNFADYRKKRMAITKFENPY